MPARRSRKPKAAPRKTTAKTRKQQERPGVSQAVAASYLDIATRTLRELVAAGRLPNPKTATLDELRLARLRDLREQAAGRGGDGKLDLATERARLAKEQADGQAMKNAQLAGELLRRDDVIRTWATEFASVKSRIRGIPKRARRQMPGFTREMELALLARIDEVLSEFAGDGLPAGRSDDDVEDGGEGVPTSA